MDVINIVLMVSLFLCCFLLYFSYMLDFEIRRLKLGILKDRLEILRLQILNKG